MREGIYWTNSNEKKLVLNALSLGKGKDFESPIISLPQRGSENSPVIPERHLNSMILSTYSFYHQEVHITPLFANYADFYMLNRYIFGNWRRKDV